MIREVDYQNGAKWTVDVNSADKLARPFRILTTGVANGYQSGDMFLTVSATSRRSAGCNTSTTV
jgi:hypothetical protein